MLGWYILGAVGALLVIFVAVLLIRAAAFRPHENPTPLDCDTAFDRTAAVERLRTLIRFRTISRYTREEEDEGEFRALIDALPTLYPGVFRACSFTELPDRALLFCWRGKTAGEPTVLMAHYDVVPVDEGKWTRPPFDAVLEGDLLYGRGALDTKVTFNAILSAADTLIEKGVTPAHDVYFAFSGGEEVNGRGAANIVDYFEEHGITPALVLDEGGAVVEGVFPGVKAPCGLIGIAEKGMMDVSYKTLSRGGHASAPKPHTPVGVLSRACCRMEAHPFKSHLTPPVAKMFDTLGRHSSFLYRLIFANLFVFAPVLDVLCKKQGGELNALMRTTVAFTCMQGSDATNVIPPEATMVSNLRLNPADSVAGALAYIRRTVDDEAVEVTALRSFEPSRISRTDCEGWDRVARALSGTWQGAIVSPYLMVQCSDSRHWGRLSDRVYRFSAMDLTSEERATIHGNDEHIRLETLYRSVEFYLRLMNQC